MKRILSLFAIMSIAMSIQAQKINGAWTGEIAIGNNKLGFTINIIKDSAGTDVCSMDVPAQMAIGIPLHILSLTEDTLAVECKALGLWYKGTLQNDSITGTFFQHGFTIPVILSRKSSVQRPQTPKPLFPYKTEDVTIKSHHGDVTLGGTLTYPIGYNGKKKPKAVVFITGSGQEDRDETIFGHKIFAVLADCLARNGVASLRCDDRGIGQSKGEMEHITTISNEKDTELQLNYMRKTGLFNSVGVIGHSEGGAIAFMLAAEKKVDFIISMAGVGIRGDSLYYMQLYDKLKGTPYVDKTYSIISLMKEATEYKGKIDSYWKAKLVVDSMLAAKKLSLPDELMATTTPVNILAGKADWTKCMLAMDFPSYIKRITCPVMAINGSLDPNVNATVNLNSIRMNLPKDTKNFIKEYPSMNHMFQICKTSNPAEIEQTEQTISPEVLKDIINWITELRR